MVYLQQLEERLVRSFMSGWQRRGSSFLQVGLHSYIAPEFFWDAGFDVCAIDENLNALNYALNCSGPRVEYQLGKVDYLPFEDDSFDYAFFTSYVSPHYKTMKANISDSERKFKLSNMRPEKLQEKESHKKESQQEELQEKISAQKSTVEKSTVEKIKESHSYKANFPLRVQATKMIQETLRQRKNQQSFDPLPTFLKDASFQSLFSESSVFSESCRVARKGIIILFKNSFSMQELPALGNSINPWLLWKLAKQMFPEGNVQIITSVMLPEAIRKRCKLIDIHSHVPLLGGLVGICINFNAPAVTGLGVLSNITSQKELIEKPIVNSIKLRNK